MTPVFSAIPTPKGGWLSKTRYSRPSSPTNNTNASAIVNSDLFPPEPEDPDLRNLNASLQALTEIFPDIQPEVFREMLSGLSEDSRLELVTENLLKHGAKWVQGRYRVPREHEPKRHYRYRNAAMTDSRGAPLTRDEQFRTEDYKGAVKDAFYQEFKGLSRSTIRAVLAEHNYSYTQSRPVLLSLAARSWRSSFANFVMRRKLPSAQNHPLITWQAVPTGSGNRTPRLTPTSSRELNKELYDTLVSPLLTKRKAEQELQDRALAEQMNEDEAEAAAAMFDCECCFTSSTFENLSICDNGAHYICFRCVRHAINEAIYGQGWARNISPERCTLRCIAPITDSVNNCQGCVPADFVKRALMADQNAHVAWQRLEERAATEDLIKSQVPLVRCPFCVYAEIDDFYPNNRLRRYRFRNRPLLMFLAIVLLQLLYLDSLRNIFRWFVLATFLFITSNHLSPRPIQLHKPFARSIDRLTRKRRGLKFTCLSPTCGRSSCLSCKKEWYDVHTCFESERLALRTYIERAKVEAIKRTCPACNLSFVKASGCNKLTCVCGYQMCYVCRQEIGKESYAHFCQHFKPDPGRSCVECERCDLYKTEDEDVMIRRAAKAAERRWREREGGQGLGWELRASAPHTFSCDPTVSMFGPGFWKNETWESWLDLVMETFIA